MSDVHYEPPKDEEKPRKSIRDDEFAERVKHRRERSELSDEEIAALRQMLKQDDRVLWFWSTVKTWAVWVAAVIAGVTIGWDALGRIVQLLSRK